MDTRPAEAADLPTIVELTRMNRARLASWSPVFFRPRDGADEAHGAYLGFLVHSSDHTTTAFVDAGGDVVGFFHLVAQPCAMWVDDLCFMDAGFWVEGADCLATVGPPWVTNVARQDEVQAEALSGIGLIVASTYFSKLLPPVSEVGRPSRALRARQDGDPLPTPRHTFGGSAFRADTPGALLVTDDDGGVLIGSPGAEPPIYDPGGPTCVVDRVTGPERGELVNEAVGVAAARGDAQMIVVCAKNDVELEAALTHQGFTPQVDLYLSDP